MRTSALESSTNKLIKYSENKINWVGLNLKKTHKKKEVKS